MRVRKFSDNDIVNMVRMRLAGLTLDEIGATFGVAGTTISTYIASLSSRKAGIPYSTWERVIYPAMRDWLDKNVSSHKMLVELLGRNGEDPQLLTKKLYGRTCLKMKDIKDLLNLTGMTFEQAFNTVKE